MSQKHTTSSGLKVRTAVRAGAFSRVDQPDPPNRKARTTTTTKTKKRRLVLAQFGVNEHGVPTFIRA